MQGILPCLIPLFRDDGWAIPDFLMIALKRFRHFHTGLEIA